MGLTARLGLPYPELNVSPNGPVQIQNLALALDAAVVYAQGLLSARPAFGLQGRLYHATDTGLVYYDTGTSWIAVGGSAFAALLDDAQVLEIGVLNNRRAGRVLTAADFTDLGLQAPAVLYNLSDLTDVSGNARALTNKGGVTFGKGITGNTPEAAIFTGSVAQALYRADEAATSIAYGSWGCWFRTAKRDVAQYLVSKLAASGAGNTTYFSLALSANKIQAFSNGQAANPVGMSDVADDRWHFAVATWDGSVCRLYIDGVLDAQAIASAWAPASVASPMNIGGYGADGATNATLPHFGRIDEAFVTPDVLTEDQIRQLMAKKIAHGLSAAPVEFSLMVNRRRRGAPLASADFPSQPLRLHNFTAGALTDEGSNNQALTNNGGTLAGPGADGETGDAFNFDGTDDYLSATDTGLPAGVTSRSMGAWFKFSTAHAGTIIGYGTDTTGPRLRTQATGALDLWDGTTQYQCNRNVMDGQWHFGVVVLDNGAADGLKVKIYIDSLLDFSSTTSFASTTLAGASGFRLGAGATGIQFFKGGIDAAFIHSVVLTPEEIAALYAKGAQALGQSPKNAGDHIERVDATNVYYLFDSIEPQNQVDLRVRS